MAETAHTQVTSMISSTESTPDQQSHRPLTQEELFTEQQEIKDDLLTILRLKNMEVDRDVVSVRDSKEKLTTLQQLVLSKVTQMEGITTEVKSELESHDEVSIEMAKEVLTVLAVKRNKVDAVFAKFLKKKDAEISKIEKDRAWSESQIKETIAEMSAKIDGQLKKLQKPAKKRFIFKKLGLFDGDGADYCCKPFETISEERFKNLDDQVSFKLESLKVFCAKGCAWVGGIDLQQSSGELTKLRFGFDCSRQTTLDLKDFDVEKIEI